MSSNGVVWLLFGAAISLVGFLALSGWLGVVVQAAGLGVAAIGVVEAYRAFTRDRD